MPKEPIIDIHQHAMQAMLEQDGKPIINPVTGKPSEAGTDEALLQGTLVEMDKHNIVKGLVCGSFDILTHWVDTAPDRFIPSPRIRGYPPSPNVQLIRKEIEEGRIFAIGEIVTQYSGIPPNDPALEPYFALAEELNVPIWIHTAGGGGFNPSFRLKAGNPLLLEDVIVKHPNLRLCVAHAGYPFLAEMVSIMLQYPQVYADISMINWALRREAFHDYLHSLVRNSYDIHPSVKHGVIYGKPIAKRLMFGSDQFYWPEAISMAVESLELANFLSEQQKRDIFYNNAARFIRLKE